MDFGMALMIITGLVFFIIPLIITCRNYIVDAEVVECKERPVFRHTSSGKITYIAFFKYSFVRDGKPITYDNISAYVHKNLPVGSKHKIFVSKKYPTKIATYNECIYLMCIIGAGLIFLA